MRIPSRYRVCFVLGIISQMIGVGSRGACSWRFEYLKVPIVKYRTSTVRCFRRTCICKTKPAGQRDNLIFV